MIVLCGLDYTDAPQYVCYTRLTFSIGSDRPSGPARNHENIPARIAPWHGGGPAVLQSQRRPARPKLAAICTTYFKYSHDQHIVDRFLEGYGWNGTHHHPAMDLVSIYIDQIGASDVSRSRLQQFPAMKLYPSIAEALTLGGQTLAVDGVVLIGEHGRYPRNEKGQTLYPRYEFFNQIVKVFKDSGRSVPVFNDKHLSWNWEWAREMYDTSRRMGFPLMAGSCDAVAAGIQSTQFFLSPEPNVTYSACLVRKIEDLSETGNAPCPVERTLLVSGVLESCLTSRFDGQKRLETPHLNVQYRAPQRSQHTRT
jgi:hypothetical protein